MIQNSSFEFLIITGMSGAGKSQAIHFFEDRGFFCIDNLPASLLTSFVDIYNKSRGKIKKVAFVIDIRSWNFIEDFYNELKGLRESGINYKILFLDAKDDVILQRFNLTRRKHPLEVHNTLLKNIEEERRRLEEIRSIATIIIDTSNLTNKELIAKLEDEIDGSDRKKINMSFVSFGFKYGIPIDIDMLFDVRFLPNPYYIDALKEKDGNDVEVQEYVMKFEESHHFLEKIKDMIDYLIPNFIKEGKSHLTIGIGCSGGKHRSVTFVNRLYDYYAGKKECKASLYHRDNKK